MEPPPDSKRQRLSWSTPSSSPHGSHGSRAVSLPRPHAHPQAHAQAPPQGQSQQLHQPQHPHPHPHHQYPHQAQLPPPPALPPPHTSPSHYPSYPPRHPEPPHSSGPPTPGHHTGPAPPPQHLDSERRHHEQEPYPPMQKHYQPHHQQPPPPQHHPHHPPPSPAHGHYPSYPPRDHPPPPAIVKREGTEDGRRSNSTGHAPDNGLPPHPPPTPHHPLPPPQPYADTQPRHISYENGGSVPSTPNPYRAQGYPAPPTPVAQQAQPPPPPPQAYDNQSAYSEHLYNIYPSSHGSKKKNTRASQACDQCRQLKAKCDETKPCKTCRDKGTECRYRDPVPKATDKAQADILDGITAMQATLQTLTSQFGRMDERLTKIEGLAQRPPPLQIKPELMAIDQRPVESYAVNGASVEGTIESTIERTVEGTAEPPPLAAPVQRDMEPGYFANPSDSDTMMNTEPPLPLRMMAEDEIEAEPGPPVPPGEPAIPINHTTLAGLLLDWPDIRELTASLIENEGIKFVGEFPISQEQNRGPLIVHGRGEDGRRQRQTKKQDDYDYIDMADDSSDTASPSPAADFGQLGGQSPHDSIDYKGGVLGFDGSPDFSEETVKRHIDSFYNNMLNMHPIIQPKHMWEWVRHFLDTLPMSQTRPYKTQAAKASASFAVNPGSAGHETAGSKRKRSPGPDGSDGPSTPSATRHGKPNRSITSALVLTMLALGKICQFRSHVPDAVHTTPDPVPHGSPAGRNGMPLSPNHSSPPGYPPYPHSSNNPSPLDPPERVGSHSRRPSLQGPAGLRSGYNLKKNYDVLPGLEYFSYATDILGNYHGSYCDMKVVYANIFAGLYYGQLARPLESFAYIHRASHTLQVIMRPSLDKMRQHKANAVFITEPKYNQLALAFWTCLQLESDILAELQLPPSGLLSYEDGMPHPNMSLLEGFPQRVLDSYPGQLYMRTHLNSIHRMFYSPKEDESILDQAAKLRDVQLVSDAVAGMHWVAPSFAFKEQDEPARDILSARLRAKYWGAQMITYRPFIRYIMQLSRSTPRDEVPEVKPTLLQCGERGIFALMESTKAFHGLGEERPIITNVFGTAHAQWGNLLVLSAAYRDRTLSKFVDPATLEYLFDKTISFLRRSATATSSLRIDLHILEGLKRELFLNPDPRQGSSFSSASFQTPKITATTSSQMVRQVSDSSNNVSVTSAPHGTPGIAPVPPPPPPPPPTTNGQ